MPHRYKPVRCYQNIKQGVVSGWHIIPLDARVRHQGFIMKTEIKMSDTIGKTIQDFAFSNTSGQAVIVFADDTFATLGVHFGYEDRDVDIVEDVLIVSDFGDSELERVGIVDEKELEEIRKNEHESWLADQRIRDLEQLERLKKRLGV